MSANPDFPCFFFVFFPHCTGINLELASFGYYAKPHPLVLSLKHGHCLTFEVGARPSYWVFKFLNFMMHIYLTFLNNRLVLDVCFFIGFEQRYRMASTQAMSMLQSIDSMSVKLPPAVCCLGSSHFYFLNCFKIKWHVR